MDNRVIERVSEYWEGLRSGRAAPARSEIDPRAIDEALENLFILELRQHDDLRFRLSGRRINLIFGREMRGLSAAEMIDPASASQFLHHALQALRGPATALLDLCSAGTGELDGQMILLPLTSDSGELDRLLGCFATNPVLPAAPVRLLIREQRLLPVVVAKPVKIETDLPGFSDPPTPFVAAPRPTLIRAFDNVTETAATGPRGQRPVLTVIRNPD